MYDNKKESILKNSKFIHLKIEGAINGILANKGITAAQSHVLMYILDRSDKNVCSAEIHRVFNISRATVSGLIKKLRLNGYLTYESCEGDERQKNIAVTKKSTGIGGGHRKLHETNRKHGFSEFYSGRLGNNGHTAEKNDRKYRKNKRRRESSNERDYCTGKTV